MRRGGACAFSSPTITLFFHEGLVVLLNNTRDIRVVGEVECADELGSALAANPCDILWPAPLKPDRFEVESVT
jgi:hypothetical protein